MNVYIKPKVDAFVKAFYEKAMTDHITLDEPTIVAKVNRLYDAIKNNLSTFPYKYRKALYRKSWIAAGYRDYPVESFHFAYKVYVNEKDEQFVIVHDACYDKNYHS